MYRLYIFYLERLKLRIFILDMYKSAIKKRRELIFLLIEEKRGNKNEIKSE